MAYERGSASGYGAPVTCSDNEDNSVLSSKRAKLLEEEEEDRLSSLPDFILLHILSFLELKDIARTGVLSKRWQYLWTDSSELDFRENNRNIENTRGFVDWVVKTLVICSGIHLKKFGVAFAYKDCFASSIDLWVQFVIKNKVKDVALHLYVNDDDDFYKLPQMMYANSSLTNLILLNCTIAPLGNIHWESLTSLSIGGSELSDSVMEIILSGCPVLKFLKLIECCGARILHINTQSLKELVIENWIIDHSSQPWLEIFAPYIQDLSITKYLNSGPREDFRLIGISSIVSANLAFNIKDSLPEHMKQLFTSLQHVEELKLGTWLVKVLIKLLVNGWKLPLQSCKRLTLNAFRNEWNIPGILCMLESSSNLETLVISERFFDFDKAHSDALLKVDLNCDLLHLKTASFTTSAKTYVAGEVMLKLVQVLLKRAKVLEKMVIDFGKCTSRDYKKISQVLLKYPRSSPKAVIVLLSS